MEKKRKQELLCVEAGQIIFREGDAGDAMFLIVRDRCASSRSLGASKELALLEQGDFFGEMALLEQENRSADALALQETKLLKIGRSQFSDLLKLDPEISLRLMRRLSRSLRSAQDRLDRSLHFLSPAQKREVLNLASTSSTTSSAAPPRARLNFSGGGQAWDIHGEQTMIGRRDNVTGLVPDVDLTDVDILHSVSRCHAWLTFSGNEFFLTEEPAVKNGTQINGTPLLNGVPTPLYSGDQIAIGYVKMRFTELK